jgi:hypothetical protein
MVPNILMCSRAVRGLLVPTPEKGGLRAFLVECVSSACVYSPVPFALSLCCRLPGDAKARLLGVASYARVSHPQAWTHAVATLFARVMQALDTQAQAAVFTAQGAVTTGPGAGVGGSVDGPQPHSSSEPQAGIRHGHGHGPGGTSGPGPTPTQPEGSLGTGPQVWPSSSLSVPLALAGMAVWDAALAPGSVQLPLPVAGGQDGAYSRL